ncbi:MAG: ABC transporter permease [Ktedonobacteraceae bacterium]
MSVITSTTKDAPSAVRTYAQAQNGVSDLQQRPVRTPKARTPGRNVTGRVLSIAPPLVLALLLLVSWYVSTTTGHVSSLFLPTPGDVLTSLADGLGSGMYLRNALVVTVQESVFGFLLAVVIALPLGYGLAKSRFLSITIQPYLSAGQAIPTLVIAPFLILWLGYGLVPNMVICMLVVLFPMVINTILGVQTIDSAFTDAARVEGAAGWSLLAHIEFPLALPALLAAVRVGFTLSITGAIVGEFVSGGDTGLGSLVQQGLHQYNTPLMFATIIVLAVLAALYYAATWLLVKLAEIIY